LSCVVSSLDCLAGAALRGLRVGAGLVVVLFHKHFGGFVVIFGWKVEKRIV